LGRLRILGADPIPDTRRAAMVLMVLEGILEAGASLQYKSCHLRILALAKPSYKRKQADRFTSADLLDEAKQGETVEALVDITLFDYPFMDLLYRDFEFQ